jgi:hypothetical protein
MEVYIDFDVPVPHHFGKADVRTAAMAVKSSKSIKTHKLKPRSSKRDATKTEEKKWWSKCRKMERAASAMESIIHEF